MLLGDLRTFRRLVPAFTLDNCVFCWECTLCHKLFMHYPYDAKPTPEQMAEVSSEFEHHDCAIQLAVSRDRLKRALSS
ncbi:MAG: hypothetical protein ACXVZX_11820 [Terriglobales bacterium]